MHIYNSKLGQLPKKRTKFKSGPINLHKIYINVVYSNQSYIHQILIIHNSVFKTLIVYLTWQLIFVKYTAKS